MTRVFICMSHDCHMILQGRFSLAARYHSSVAEIYESELQEYENAITNYEQAADFHRGEDSLRWGVT